MNKTILSSELFSGLPEDKIKNILSCIKHEVKIYKNKSYLYDFSTGFKAGIILKGRIDLISIDEDGREIIDRSFETGDSFAFRFDSLINRFLYANKDSELLCLDAEEIFAPNKKACHHRSLFMENIIEELDRQMAYLSFKMDIYNKTNIRDKILTYYENGNYKIQNYTQQELANFLACNRSALAREISKMKSEGII